MSKNKIGQGKNAVITGASSGIGKVIAKQLSRFGYNLICVSRSKPERVECDYFECDLSDPSATETVGTAIAEKYRHIDLLINNAGLGISGATELLPMDSIRYVTEVDYFAPLIFTRAVLPSIPQKSKIVMISSACALFALPYRGIYCSAKSALNMLSFGLRMELKASKIDVVCICPGDIKSNFTANRLKFGETNERYGESVEKARRKVDDRQDKRMNTEKAGKKIAKISVKKRGALYIVGAKYKFLYFLSRIATQNFMLKVTNKMFNPR